MRSKPFNERRNIYWNHFVLADFYYPQLKQLQHVWFFFSFARKVRFSRDFNGETHHFVTSAFPNLVSIANEVYLGPAPNESFAQICWVENILFCRWKRIYYGFLKAIMLKTWHMVQNLSCRYHFQFIIWSEKVWKVDESVGEQNSNNPWRMSLWSLDCFPLNLWLWI